MHPRTLKLLVTTAVVTLLLSTAAVAQPARRVGHRPRPKDASLLVIGHRGASGYRPEHTMASYKLAIRLGADYIEPDLVSTSDGILVARHENEISQTTDVDQHPEFADRRTTKMIDGRPLTGWFTEDFTLRELRTLRAKERIPDVRQRNTLYNGRELIPTFQQVINLAKRASRRGRTIGIYPETKHPTYFDSIGLSLEEPLVRALRRNGLDRRKAAVFVQSFETANLRQLDKVVKVPLVQLIPGSGAPYDRVAAGSDQTYDDLVTTRTASSPAIPAASCRSPPRWWTTRTRLGCWCTPTRSATRTPSCRRITAAVALPTTTATRSPSTSGSSNWASTASSATTRTLPWRLGEASPTRRTDRSSWHRNTGPATFVVATTATKSRDPLVSELEEGLVRCGAATVRWAPDRIRGYRWHAPTAASRGSGPR
jgi:glycerophosphoryl diester phosphodiesterase